MHKHPSNLGNFCLCCSCQFEKRLPTSVIIINYHHTRQRVSSALRCNPILCSHWVEMVTDYVVINNGPYCREPPGLSSFSCFKFRLLLNKLQVQVLQCGPTSERYTECCFISTQRKHTIVTLKSSITHQNSKWLPVFIGLQVFTNFISQQYTMATVYELYLEVWKKDVHAGSN